MEKRCRLRTVGYKQPQRRLLRSAVSNAAISSFSSLILSGVKRPGDFAICREIETPLPRVDVEGVGTLSFPVPENQVRQLIEHALRAPYGRGEETLHDDAVRKTRQIEASAVKVTGKGWQKTFDGILAAVREGLGLGDMPFLTELYKLLIYDTGGFFAAHRDTEKASGMFGPWLSFYRRSTKAESFWCVTRAVNSAASSASKNPLKSAAPPSMPTANTKCRVGRGPIR